VRPDRQVLGDQAFGLHLPDPAVRGGGRPFCAGRSPDPRFCPGGGPGRRRPDTRQPAPIGLYLRAGPDPEKWAPVFGKDQAQRVFKRFCMQDVGMQARRQSVPVQVGNVTVGGGAPIVVQSMTNTDTADVDSTVRQVAALANAGSEIVRITVDRDEAAAAVPKIKERLLKIGCEGPIVGGFHYIGHKLLADHPGCAEALDKYRINPGNVGFKDKKDRQFSAIVEMAIKHDKPVRIGANWGSLDQELLTHLMDENSKSNQPKDAR